ncbi:hypothetical protein DRO54_02735 [Candidatus Bathyarchaeota archaeon]|nr:MAG: hypothetical protein DRO54_02735 [Candidatus Bathyarchaeota archaeon]
MKRKASSFSFTLRKFWDKILTFKPSIWIISGVLIALTIFFLGGGIYDLLERPVPVGMQQGRVITFYPYGINEQLLGESILVMILYGLGAVGLILTYQSTKFAYKPRQAYMMLLVGVCLIILAYLFVELSLRQKMR